MSEALSRLSASFTKTQSAQLPEQGEPIGGRDRFRARIGRQTVSLPLSPKLSDEDVQDVIAAVRDVLGVA